MRARHFLEKELITVQPEDPVGFAAEQMIRHDLSALPVVDAAGTLVGVVSELDLLHLLLPDYVASLVNLRFVPEDISPGVCNLDNVCQVLVRQAMGTTEAGTVDEDDPILEVVRMMVEECLPYACVMQEGRLVGMLEARRLVRQIAEAREPGDQPS